MELFTKEVKANLEIHQKSTHFTVYFNKSNIYVLSQWRDLSLKIIPWKNWVTCILVTKDPDKRSPNKIKNIAQKSCEVVWSVSRPFFAIFGLSQSVPLLKSDKYPNNACIYMYIIKNVVWPLLCYILISCSGFTLHSVYVEASLQ